MTIARVPLTFDASYYSSEWNVPRSSGVHLMQIVERMEQERDELLGNRKPRLDATAEELEAYRFGGFMFEHLIAQHIIDVECARTPVAMIRPGEYFWCSTCELSEATADPRTQQCLLLGHIGIFATPDALRTDTWRLKEWKFTWKSLRRAGGDNDTDGRYENLRDGIWRWPIQTMAYCYLLETEGADLEAFFVNGDYTDRRPKIMRYEMDFTKRELKENWDAIVNTAKSEEWL